MGNESGLTGHSSGELADKVHVSRATRDAITRIESQMSWPGTCTKSTSPFLAHELHIVTHQPPPPGSSAPSTSSSLPPKRTPSPNPLLDLARAETSLSDPKLLRAHAAHLDGPGLGQAARASRRILVPSQTWRFRSKARTKPRSRRSVPAQVLAERMECHKLCR